MPYYDFEQIKADNPIEHVAEQLGLQLKKSGGQFRGPCPVCDGGPRCLAITPSKSAWYCFGAKLGGDVIALVGHIKDCDAKTAAQFLSSPEKMEQKPKPSEGDGFKPLEYLVADHEAVIALGFEPDDAERIGVGYAPRGVMRGKVAIPVRDEAGRLLGYIGVEECVLPGSWHF